MITLDSIQPTYSPPPLDTIPDEAEDKPHLGSLTASLNGIPPLIFGAGSLSAQYNTDDHLRSDVPFRTVRLALRYGITSFDTSAYYGASELVLGSILKALAPEFPRESYHLMSKCGRYGTEREHFDYSPKTIRQSLQRTLQRLETTYLDFFSLHDIEFVASSVHPVDTSGDSLVALTADAGREAWGLKEGDEVKVHGEGDQKIIAAYGELIKMKEEGLVRNIGITGYPLPVLLRLLRLLRAHFPKSPPSSVLSYSHYQLQNSRLRDYIPHFLSTPEHDASFQIFNASPLNMGFLTPNIPWWSPARSTGAPGEGDLLDAKAQADIICETNGWTKGLANLALGYGLRQGSDGLPSTVPTVVGFSGLKEVHEAVAIWKEVNQDENSDQKEERRRIEELVLRNFVEAGWSGWSWASPLPQDPKSTAA